MTGGWLMWAPLAANVALALTGPRLARALPPGIAVRLLPVALVVVAAGTGLVLAAVGFFALAQCAPVALLGHWSPSEVRSEQPMPTAAEVVAGIVVVLLLAAPLLRAPRGVPDPVDAAAAPPPPRGHGGGAGGGAGGRASAVCLSRRQGPVGRAA